MKTQPDSTIHKLPFYPVGMLTIAKGLMGASVGAVLGYFIFVWLHSIGLYAFILPGALVGLGCGFAAKSRSILFSIIALIIGLAVTVLCEWQTNWFVDENGDDKGLLHLILNLHQSRGGMAAISVALNGIVAFWLGRRG